MPDPEAQRQALVKTFRYLRITMVLLVLLLAVSVLYERWGTGVGCWQTSLSAYWYTPSRPVLVGVLVAIGLCLVALKSSTVLEDGLLNVAGLLAPVVAFVPVPRGDVLSGPCPARAANETETLASIANTMTAYLLVGAVAWVLASVVAWVSRDRVGARPVERLAFLGIALVLLVGAGAWFWAGRDSFVELAHYAAAVPMFLCFVAVVVWSARRYGLSRSDEWEEDDGPLRYVNRYLSLAVIMVAGTAGMALVAVLTGWTHVVLAVEAWLILTFAVFWVLQTVELWDSGLRREAGEAPSSPDLPS